MTENNPFSLEELAGWETAVVVGKSHSQQEVNPFSQEAMGIRDEDLMFSTVLLYKGIGLKLIYVIATQLRSEGIFQEVDHSAFQREAVRRYRIWRRKQAANRRIGISEPSEN